MREDRHGFRRNVFLVARSGWLERLDGESLARPAYWAESPSGGFEWVDWRMPVDGGGNRNVLRGAAAWAEMPRVGVAGGGEIFPLGKENGAAGGIIS